MNVHIYLYTLAYVSMSSEKHIKYNDDEIILGEWKNNSFVKSFLKLINIRNTNMANKYPHKF